MAITISELQEFIQTAIPDAVLKIDDLAGDGDHYAVHVISASFANKTRIQQHQMVYEALNGHVGGKLHALSIRTSIPSITAPVSLKKES